MPSLPFGKLPHKADEPLLESGGIQHTQRSGTCIVAGDAVVQFEEGLQEFPFGVAEKFHIGASLTAAEHSAKGDYQDVVEGIAAGVAGAGASRVLNRLANWVMAASPLLQFHSTPSGVDRYHTEHRKIHMR